MCASSVLTASILVFLSQCGELILQHVLLSCLKSREYPCAQALILMLQFALFLCSYNKPGATPGVGWILASMFFVDSVLVGMALQRMGDACVRLGIKVRAAMMTAVYRKTFALNSVSAPATHSLTLKSKNSPLLIREHIWRIWVRY